MHNNNEQNTFGFDVRLRLGEADEEAGSGRPKGRRGGGKSAVDPAEQKLYDGIADTRLRGWPMDNAEATGDGLVCSSAVQYLHKNKDRKFFLHVSMVKPHWPWSAPKEFYSMYDPQKIDLPPLIPGDLDDDPIPNSEFSNFKWNQMTEAQRRLGRARYYGSLSWLDSHVKRLLDTLDELKLADKTLVIYTTDHGDMAAEKGLWLKTLMFDSSARVPLLMRMPGVVKPGITNGVLINHVDLFPTLAGLVGTEKDLPSNVTGKNLTGSILRGEPGPEYTFSVYGIKSADEAPERMMARSQRWKLIRYNRYLNEGLGLVLYDMQNDPDEVKNLARDPQYKEIVATHSAALDRFLASLKKPDYPVVKLAGERKQRIQ
jgi:iduronate 2-sulfatase